MFEFTGRNLIGDADKLINALRDLKLVSLNTSTPAKIDKSSLTSYLDRMITSHLTKYPEDTARLMTDEEVLRLRFFERNPDLGMSVKPTQTPTRTTFTQRIGPFTPLGSVTEAGSDRVEKDSKTPVKMTPTRVTTAPGSLSVEEEIIKVDVSQMSTSVIPKGGKKEADMIKGLQHLKNNKVIMDLDPKDFKMFTYWIREKDIREHMEHTICHRNREVY